FGSYSGWPRSPAAPVPQVSSTATTATTIGARAQRGTDFRRSGAGCERRPRVCWKTAQPNTGNARTKNGTKNADGMSRAHVVNVTPQHAQPATATAAPAQQTAELTMVTIGESARGVTA